jgi:hypothetical protein
MRLVPLIVVGLPVIAGALVLALVRPSKPIPVDVGFLGYTNLAEGRFATFALTNRSVFSVRRWGRYEPQSKRYWREEGRWTYDFGADATLAPGQSDVVAVPAIVDRGVWRVVFAISREGWRTRLDDWVEASPRVRDIVPHRPQQFVLSQWIEP